MFKFINKLKKDNRGSEAITRLITYMAFLLIAAVALDLVSLGLNVAMGSYQTMYVSKKLSAQGGWIGGGGSYNAVSQPVYKDDSSWLYNGEIIANLQNSMNYIGVGENDWSLEANEKGSSRYIYKDGYMGASSHTYVSPWHYTIKNPVSGRYYSPGLGGIGEITLEFSYTWRFAGRMLPGNMKPKIVMKSNYKSEYVR